MFVDYKGSPRYNLGERSCLTYMATPVYEKENVRRINFKLNKKFDKDLIDWVEQQPNIQSYLKDLIRADIAAKNPAAEAEKEGE